MKTGQHSDYGMRGSSFQKQGAKNEALVYYIPDCKDSPKKAPNFWKLQCIQGAKLLRSTLGFVRILAVGRPPTLGLTSNPMIGTYRYRKRKGPFHSILTS